MIDTDAEARKLSRRQNILKFVKPGRRADALRVFELIDQNAPVPLKKPAPPKLDPQD